MKLQQILNQVPEIAHYASQIPVLRLKNENNHITIDNQIFELRLFTFYLTASETNEYKDFRDYVQKKKLEDQELSISVPHKHFPVLTFNRLDESAYIVLSLAEVTQ